MPSGIGPATTIFRNAFPKKALTTTSPDVVADHGKVTTTDLFLIVLPICYSYCMVCGFAWFFVLQFLGGFVARSHPDALFLIVPPPGCWALAALFLGILSSAIPSHFTLKGILGDRFDALTASSNRQQDLDGRKVVAFMAIACVVGLALLVAAALSTWVEFRGDRIIISRTWPLRSATYPYGRVVSLARIARAKAPSGVLVSRPCHAIRFDDGETWTTQEFFLQEDAQRDDAILALVSKQSSRPIQELDLIDELKP